MRWLCWLCPSWHSKTDKLVTENRKCKPIVTALLGSVNTGIFIWIVVLRFGFRSKLNLFRVHTQITSLHMKPVFAVTINKSQGQTLNKVGIYLPQPIFGHGQLNVTFSRVLAMLRSKLMTQYNKATWFPTQIQFSLKRYFSFVSKVVAQTNVSSVSLSKIT